MKIGVLASTYPRYDNDGAARFVRSLSEAIAGHGHTVHALAPFHPAVKPYASPVNLQHFRYIWPAAWGRMGYAEGMDSDRSLKAASYLMAPLYWLAASAALERLARREKLDLLHAHWAIPNGPIVASVARRLKIPYMISLHGSDIFFALRNPLLGRIAGNALRDARAITACSPHLAAGAIKLGAPDKRVHLIPWGVDANRFTPADQMPADGSILSLGRLVRKKGLETLIRAIPAILAKQPEARFVIAGDGPERSELHHIASELGVSHAVSFPGNISWDETPQLYRKAAMFVVPSLDEPDGNQDGLPTTIIEAMASGLPVVASRTAGIPLAIGDGLHGILTQSGDVEGLSHAIAYLLQNPKERQELGAAARLRVESELNWPAIAARIISLV